MTNKSEKQSYEAYRNEYLHDFWKHDPDYQQMTDEEKRDFLEGYTTLDIRISLSYLGNVLREGIQDEMKRLYEFFKLKKGDK